LRVDSGAILVSSTVRDIMLGSDLRFDDAGEHLLKGFDGQWRLFAVEPWRLTDKPSQVVRDDHVTHLAYDVAKG
jgi:class 3 adenylate cyclase